MLYMCLSKVANQREYQGFPSSSSGGGRRINGGDEERESSTTTVSTEEGVNMVVADYQQGGLSEAEAEVAVRPPPVYRTNWETSAMVMALTDVVSGRGGGEWSDVYSYGYPDTSSKTSVGQKRGREDTGSASGGGELGDIPFMYGGFGGSSGGRGGGGESSTSASGGKYSLRFFWQSLLHLKV